MPHAHPSGFPPRAQHGEGQALALREGETFFHRRAGACPPRSLGRADAGEGQVFPPPYVKGRRFFHRRAGPVLATMKHPQFNSVSTAKW